MSSVEKCSGLIVVLGLLSMLAISEAFYMPGYYIPTYYQRYMDENQAVLQNLMAMEEVKEQQTHPSEQKPTVNKETPEVRKHNSDDVMPRRDLRQYFQQKRMRPCFYSPIQCLMKRSQA